MPTDEMSAGDRIAELPLGENLIVGLARGSAVGGRHLAAKRMRTNGQNADGHVLAAPPRSCLAHVPAAWDAKRVES